MQKKRLSFIDLLRGWALLVMIEVHVTNSMIPEALKHGPDFRVLNFINGLVAPSFLFVSGFAFVIAGRRKIEEFRTFGYQFFRQIGRILLIFLAGYSLHLPFLSIKKINAWCTPENIEKIYTVDVLQCIAAGLLIMFVLRVIIKSEKLYAASMLVLTAVFVIPAPAIWQTDFSGCMPKFLTYYLAEPPKSLFPLFPWLGFMFSGALGSMIYLKAKDHDFEKSLDRNALIASFITIIVTSVILMGPNRLFDYFSKIKPSPFFFLLRLGIVLAMLLFFKFYSEKRHTEKSLVISVGQQSLLIYWLHLQLIYRKIINGESLVAIFKGHVGAPGVIAIILGLVIICMLAAKLWGSLKKEKPVWAELTTISVVLGGIIFFFIG